MAKIDLISNDWVELVFEGKNHSYGAYRLRRSTAKRNFFAIVFMLIFAAVIATIIGVNIIIENAKAKDNFNQEVELSQLAKKKEAKIEKKAPVKMEEKKIVENVKSSIKFVPPVIKKDSEVKPEEEMKTQADLQKTNTSIGAFTVKGNDEAGGTILKAKEEIVQPEPVKEVAENKVFDVVEVMPSFPGGPAALMSYLSKNIKYPTVAEETGIQGRVIVTFVVERDGSITDVQVAKSVDPSLDKEAQRVVRSMPRWIPGKQNGSAVRVKYTVPVTFRLQ
jgi:tonB family C-terminal domain